MARVPTSANISGPGSLRSGRGVARQDTTAVGEGLAAFGRGVQSFGGSIAQVAQQEREQQNALDIARAETTKTERLLGIRNSFDLGGDNRDTAFDTYGQRALTSAQQAVEDAAQLIRDPEMRERWKLTALNDAARTADSVTDLGASLQNQQQVVSFEETLEANRRLFTDPTLSSDVQDRARADIEGSIDMALASGLVTPAQAEQWRTTYLDNAVVTRAENEINTYGPDAIGGTFEEKLVQRESSGNPTVVNQFGYAGLYQFGAPRAAHIGIYSPGPNENLSGWSSTGKNAAGKWTGTFNIPGFPEVRSLNDFLSSPEAQRKAFEIHRNQMDREIESGGLDQYIGQRIGGVEITREGLYAMIHLGGAGGARRALESGGAENAADANGTTLLAYAEMGERTGRPEYWDSLPPEQQIRLEQAARAARNQQDAEARARVQMAAQDAPAAIQNTGEYTGYTPTAQDFISAYGPIEAPQRIAQYQASVQTAEQAYDMRTMSIGDIEAMVSAARPTATGEGAALETQRYDTLVKAAEATITARTEDPAAFAQQHFPQVRTAWENAATDPSGYQQALATTAAAQQQLGIPDMALLPNTVADQAIQSWNNTEVPERDRVDAVTGLIMATPDTEQRRAVFNQLVDAGLPAMTEGALYALERGDEGAARRLFMAAMIDPTDLPGTLPETPQRISEEIQSQLMDVGQIGDLYYGLSDGSAENFERAARDQQLLMNAVRIRLHSGESLNEAVSAVGKDLYGDVQVVNGNWSVNARLLLPSDQDGGATLDGLEATLPAVRQALETSLAVPEGAPVDGEAQAVLGAARQNYIDSVMNDGYFRNADDGYVFIDPYLGTAVSDAQGEPVIFTEADVVEAETLARSIEADRPDPFEGQIPVAPGASPSEPIPVGTLPQIITPDGEALDPQTDDINQTRMAAQRMLAERSITDAQFQAILDVLRQRGEQ